MTASSSGAIYEALLAHCGPPTFVGPWSFLPPPTDTYGSINDPAGALAALRGAFPNEALTEAGVLRPQGDLAPVLFNPLGAIIALRTHRRQRPYALLTAWGLLPSGGVAAIDSLDDWRTAHGAKKHGAILATPFIREVVLLRALGLPASLSLGCRKSFGHAQALDVHFQGPDLRTTAAERPTLALVGWSPLTLTTDQSPIMTATIMHLARLRGLGLDLAGVSAWRPSPAMIADSRAALEFRDARLVSDLVRRSVGEDLVDLADPILPDGAPVVPDYATAAEAVRSALAMVRRSGHGADIGPARDDYRTAVIRDLVEPLLRWAMTCNHPAGRAAAMEIGVVCEQMHIIAPLIAELIDRAYEGSAAELDPAADRLLRQYVQMIGRTGQLARDVARWHHH